jgi:DNA-binding transcriptional MerR regulator
MTIAEAGKKYGMTPDTLRYYERIGLLPPVHRSAGGIRDYTPEDCRWIEFIRCMRGAGIQVEALIDYVTMFRKGDETIGARKALLMEQRRQLADRITEQQAVLERLDHKIAVYEQCVLPFEQKLQEDTLP